MKIIAVIALLLTGLNAWAEDDLSKKFGFGFAFKGEKLGADIYSPNELGWTAIKAAGGDVLLSKSGLSQDENSIIEGYLMTPDVPLDPISRYVDNVRKNIVAGYANNKVYSLIGFDIVPDKKKPRCVKVHLLLEKKAEANAENSEKMFREEFTLSCGLTKNSKFGVEIGYRQYYRASNKDPLFEGKADRLFDTVVLYSPDA